MSTIFLWFNAAAYAVLALWCTLRLGATSNAIGYTTLSNSGHSEYTTVYGGLQWGLALIFAMFAMRPELHRIGILVAILLYAPIALHRIVSVIRYAPVEKLTYGLAGLETAMLIASVAIWYTASFSRAA